MTSSLGRFSDDELKRELTRREDERLKEALSARVKHCGRVEVLAKLDAFLAVLQHSKISCSDEQPHRNYEHDLCTRCFMLELRKGYSMNDNYELEIAIVFRPLRPEQKEMHRDRGY